MKYLTEMSPVELKHNFDLAHEHLKAVFAKYSPPENMEACPCCVDEEDKEKVKRGDFSPYLWSAMTTWGGRNGFQVFAT